MHTESSLKLEANINWEVSVTFHPISIAFDILIFSYNGTGTEIAIANAVAQALDTCDNMDRPLFAVKTGTQHVLTGQGAYLCATSQSTLSWKFLLS